MVKRHLQASSKSWSLTFSSDSKDVLVWKNGSRLKLKDGLTAGRVHSVSYYVDIPSSGFFLDRGRGGESSPLQIGSN